MRNRLLAVCFGIAVGLITAEIILRVAGLPRAGPFLQEFYGQDFKLMCYDRNPSGDLDIDLRDPAQRARFESRLPREDFESHWSETPYAVEVRFNSEGYRDREPESKEEGVFRIAVVGDSFVYGHGVPEQAAFPRRLEASILHRHPEARLEVWNLGVGGFDLPDVWKVSLWALDTLEPDVLVYGYFLNDAQSSREVRRPGKAHAMADADWLHVESTGARLGIGMRERGALRTLDLLGRLFEDRNTTRDTLAWYAAMHDPQRWTGTADRIEQLAREVRDRGCRFTVVVLPLVYRVDNDYPLEETHRNIVSALRERGIDVVDVLPALQRYRDSDLILHARDRHPSSRYHQLVAEALAAAIEIPEDSLAPRIRSD